MVISLWDSVSFLLSISSVTFVTFSVGLGRAFLNLYLTFSSQKSDAFARTVWLFSTKVCALLNHFGEAASTLPLKPAISLHLLPVQSFIYLHAQNLLLVGRTSRWGLGTIVKHLHKGKLWFLWSSPLAQMVWAWPSVAASYTYIVPITSLWK